MCGSGDYDYTVTDELEIACAMAADEVQRYQDVGYQLVRVGTSYPAFPDADRSKAWARVMAGATTARTAYLCPPDTDHPVYHYVDIVPWVSTDSDYDIMYEAWQEDQD